MAIKKENKSITVFTYVCPKCKRKIEAYSESQMQYNIKLHNEADLKEELKKKEGALKKVNE
jgi:uncharacterized protein YlaI